MSAAFHFRLEPVRALRERAEDQAREELAAGLALQLRGEALLRAAAERQQAALGTHRATLPGSRSSGLDLLVAQAWLERLGAQRSVAAADLDQRAAVVTRRRELLQQAAQEREVLERLRDRQAEAFRLRAARAEEARLDELALAAHRRRDQQTGAR